jgi:hypothetical protein
MGAADESWSAPSLNLDAASGFQGSNRPCFSMTPGAQLSPSGASSAQSVRPYAPEVIALGEAQRDLLDRHQG